MPSCPRPPTTVPPPHRSRLLILLSVAVIVCAALLIVTFRHGRDQAIYALVARTIWRGGMPYRDAWDFKPPGIFLIYTLSHALFGARQWGVRGLEVVGLFATAAGMRALAQRWWGDGRIGVVAAALSALVHVQLEFWHSAQPETFGGMLTIAGLCAAVLGRGPTRGRQLLAGFLFGVAGLLKPPLAGGGAVLAVWLAQRAYRHRRTPRAGACTSRWRAGLAPIVWIGVGGTLPFALTLMWFAHRGALAELYHTLFVFTPHYTALGWRQHTFLELLLTAGGQWLWGYNGALTAGLFLLVIAGRKRWTRTGVPLLGAIIALQLLGVALQAKFFPYHFSGLWPVTAMLAVLGMWPLWRWAEQHSLKAQWLFVVTLALSAALRTAPTDLQPFYQRVMLRLAAVTVDRQRPDAFAHLSSAADVDAVDNRTVANIIAQHIPADAPLFVWGFEPQLYLLSNRRCASRFIYNVPQRASWQQRWARRTLMNDLRAAPPAALVVVHGDGMPMVTGNGDDSAAALIHFEALQQLLQEHYHRYRRVADLDIYLRRAAPAAPAK